MSIEYKENEVTIHLHIWFKKTGKRVEMEVSKIWDSLYDAVGEDNYEDENIKIWITGSLKYSK